MGLSLNKSMGGKNQKKASKTKAKSPLKTKKVVAKRPGRVAGSKVAKPKRKFFKIDSKWNRGLYKVLKQVHPDLRTTKKSMIIMNSVVNGIAERMYTELLNMSGHHQLKSVKDRDIQTAVKLLFPGELARHACQEGAKASLKFTKA